MDFKCSWKDVNVLIQDSAFIGHSLTEIRAALAALTASIVLAQTAVILKPWSRPSRSHLPKGIPLLQAVVPRVLPGSGQCQLHCDRCV